MAVLSIDFETTSLVDLRKTGAETYSKAPSTRVILMAWAFDDEQVQVWRIGDPFPQRVSEHVARGGWVRGWNVAFEFVIWNNTLTRQVAPLPALSRAQISDTMAAAAYWGLPLSLDQAGPAAGITIHKDREGHDLMMRMARPRAFDPISGTATWWHKDSPERLDRLAAYCARDVEVERALANAIPPLPDQEEAVWQADQRINERGVGVDFVLVQRLRDVAQQAASRANEEIKRLSGGAVPALTSTAALQRWLGANGYPHDNLRKETVAERLDDVGLSELERAALELRSDGAKTSAAKLNSMLEASPARGRVGRVHGMLQYYGAFRTGRWAGRIIQPQNMPRGTVKLIEQAIDAILAGADLAYLEAFFGPGMQVVSSALRGCFVAEPGNVLVVSDFSQIEARVIAWLAGQHDILQVFASGEDVYCYTASKVTGRTITKKDPERQLGKVLVLACGFGMSGSKFQGTAATYGIELSLAEAESNVRLWRRANPKIVQLWWDYDKAAKEVITRGTKMGGTCPPVAVGPVQFAMWKGHMLVRLPSGRTLCYRDAKLVAGGKYGDEITYMGVNQYTRRWERQKTYGGKLAENVTQAVARDVMAEAVLEAERQMIPVTLLVHDEIIGETYAHDGPRALAALKAIMTKPPAWAPGLPVGCDGWLGERYRK